MCHTSYHTFMVKTTVYLEDSDKRSLERAARVLGKSEAELLRQALHDFLADALPPKPTMPLFASGDPSLAENLDEAMKGFGE